MQCFIELCGWQQALVACTFTWLMTAAGAALVLFFSKVNKTAFCLMMSCAAGIMLASSFFSLLLPALEGAGQNAWLVLTVGFISGGAVIIVADVAAEKLMRGASRSARSRVVTCAAVTMHNIPEGLAVGVAFGAAGGTLSAVMLALGIGIQNFPEGMCVAFPLRAGGCSRAKSFFIGQFSGFVEVIAGVAGALAVSFVSAMLPFALAFSAGAMLAVVCSELIPQSFENGKICATVGVLAGFALMMLLDIAFG